MANRKISELPEATTTTPTDSYMIVQNGVSKKISFKKILQNLKADVHILFDVTATSTIDFIIQASGSEIFKVKGSTQKIGIKNSSPESDLHMIGNLQLGKLDGSASGVYIGSVESISHPVGNIPAGISPEITNPISNNFETTLITTFETSNYWLGAGVPGQVKTLIHVGYDGTTQGIAVINFPASTTVGFNKITLPKTGDTVTLKYLNSKWFVVGYFGASITTTS